MLYHMFSNFQVPSMLCDAASEIAGSVYLCMKTQNMKSAMSDKKCYTENICDIILS